MPPAPRANPTSIGKRRRRFRSYRMETGFRSWQRQRHESRSFSTPTQSQQQALNDSQIPPHLQNPMSSNSNNTLDILPHAEPQEILPVDKQDQPLNNLDPDEDDDPGVIDEPLIDDINTTQQNNSPQNDYGTGEEDPFVHSAFDDGTVQEQIDLQESIGSEYLPMVLAGRNMVGLSLVTGTSRLTASLYQSFRRFMNAPYRGEGKVPTYNTILYKLRPALRRHALAVHSIIEREIDIHAPGVTATVRAQAESGHQPMAKVPVALPSAWVSRDSEKISSEIAAEMDASSRSFVSRFCKSVHQNRGMYMLGEHMFCESRLLGYAYEYGRFVYPGDLIRIAFNVRDKNLAKYLVEEELVSKQRAVMTFCGKVGEGALSDNGRLRDGNGEVRVQIRIEGTSEIQAALLYRLGTYCELPSSAIELSVSGFPLYEARLSSISIQARTREIEQVAPPIGVLQDGRAYLRIPYFMFSDDFSTMGGRRGSSGGCYLAPLILPNGRRRGMGAVRVLGLTPPGVNSNTVLLHAVEDIIKCCTEGIEIVTKDGRTLVVFIHLVAYVGDYPGMVHCLDVMGHTANTPCTHCLFRRSDPKNEEENSRYAYNPSVHCADPAFRRTKRRMRLIRDAARGRESTLQYFGLSKLSDEELRQLPLHRLSDRLEEVQDQIPRTTDSLPVVNACFDPYQSCVVAPSHVLYGLTQNVLNANIRACTPQQRKRVDKIIFSVLSNVGGTTEHNLINHETAKLYTMTITNTFSVLLVAPWAFRITLDRKLTSHIDGEEDSQGLLLYALYQMRALYTETFFLPTKERDGLGVVQSMDEAHYEEYHNRLKRKCVRYVQLIDRLCCFGGTIPQELDRPNVHRLLELYHHTIPLFGHVSIVDELPFEAAHQPLKRALARSNYIDGHVLFYEACTGKTSGDSAWASPVHPCLSDRSCLRIIVESSSMPALGNTLQLTVASCRTRKLRWLSHRS